MGLLALNIITIFFKWHYMEIVMPFKILAIIMSATILLEIIASVLFGYLKNNLFFYHIFNPIEFILYSVFFLNLSMSKRINQIICTVIPLYVIAVIFSSSFVQKINEQNSREVALESIILILYSLLYLRHINKYVVASRAETNPYFWIVMGVLFYFIGTLFLEGFLDLLMKISLGTAQGYYKIGFVFKYLMCIMFAVGIFLNKNSNNIKPNK